MPDNFWAAITAQLNEIKTARTADDVIGILNRYGSPSAGDAFFAGSGGDDCLWDALDDAGWEQVWSSLKPGEGHCFYVMRAPYGDLPTYIEGDVYRGDTRPSDGS